MIYRCFNKICPHYALPCEFTEMQMNNMLGKSTACPIGEEDYFDLVDESNEFYLLLTGDERLSFGMWMKVLNNMLIHQTERKRHIVIVVPYKVEQTTFHNNIESYVKKYGYQLVYICNNEIYKRAYDYIKGKENKGCMTVGMIPKEIEKYQLKGEIAFRNVTVGGKK